MNVRDIPFTFITEDGETKLTVPEYHTRADLMEKVGLITTPTSGRRTVFVGTTIVSYPLDLLDEDPKRLDTMNQLQEIVDANPLKYYVPQHEEVLAFLNDEEHTLKALVAPNGLGKSVTGWIDLLLDIIPTKPDWPIFALHGVRRRRTRRFADGGIGIISYDFINHRDTIWPQVIRRWTPPEFLDGRAGKMANLSFRSAETVHVAGTAVTMFACSQDTTVLSGSAKDRLWWDEQPSEQHFDEANARIRRRNGRHTFTLTPHRVPGRPDTGAGSFIHKLYLGEMTAGHNVRFYKAGLDDVPDWIFSEKAKRAAYIEWVEEPLKTGNVRKLREGRARLYGDFHESSGLVFDEWQPPIHVIPDDFPLPAKKTWYRYIDHGRLHPCACIFVAALESGELVIDNEYYEPDRLVSENAKGIIEKSGNTRRKIGTIEDGGKTETLWEEVCKRRFRRTRMDPRSMGKRADNSRFSIGKLYRNNGLACLPADGQPLKGMIPMVKELLAIDPERVHLTTGQQGAPRLYVRRRCVKFCWEIAGYIHETCVRTTRNGQKEVSEKPRDKDDHLMSALNFMAADQPVYVQGADDEDEEVDERHGAGVQVARDPYTGY